MSRRPFTSAETARRWPSGEKAGERSSGKRVRSHVIGGWWKDTGKVEDMLEGNRMMLEGIATTIEGTVDAATTIEEAAELTKEMDAILARDLPYVVLFRTPIIEAYGANVQFPVESIMGGQQGFPNAWPNAVAVTE